MFEPNEVLKTLAGRGLVSADGCAPVRVRYRVVIERRADGVVAYGTLHGSHSNLRPIWIEPDAQLRLANGRRLAISLTDLVEDVAEFESTGPVGSL
jgi:predicted secreted hydrolase